MSRVLLAALAALPLPAIAQDFPLTITHRFGETVIATPPDRVATVDYAGVDNVLALGFQPLTVRQWFGPFPSQLWPWAQALSTFDPVVLEGELNFEQIAATDPDVILALRSGITADDYAKLSAIAPVIAVPPGRGDYDLDWREQARIAAAPLGRLAEAEAQIAAIDAAFTATAAAHPDWQGKTFVMMTYWDGAPGLYSVTDSAVAQIAALGLVPHPRVVDLSTPGQYYITLSEEIVPELDADVVFWYMDPTSPEIISMPARAAMRAPSEGREVYLPQDSLTTGALSHGSLLSLPDALARLAPMIDAAIDGDPATPVPLE